MTPPVVLTIAGSDSGGGAGIQADLSTFRALGLHGTTAITAITAQNTVAVAAIGPVASPLVVAQIEAVVEDFTVLAVKTGMLATEATVRAVADLASRGRLRRLVVDPVFVASVGDALAPSGIERAYLDALVPHAAVVTPNIAEAEVLLGGEIRSLTDRREAAAALAVDGPTVVITGGHVAHDDQCVVDVVAGPDGVIDLRAPHLVSTNDHGTGCTFSAAIAAGLAQDLPTLEAIGRAQRVVHVAMRAATSHRLGAGRGPVDHDAWRRHERARDPAAR